MARINGRQTNNVDQALVELARADDRLTQDGWQGRRKHFPHSPSLRGTGHLVGRLRRGNGERLASNVAAGNGWACEADKMPSRCGAAERQVVIVAVD